MDREQKQITAYLDRIEEVEDDVAAAVFLFEEEEDEFREFTLPADFLPGNANEGEYFTITISREVEKTQEALDEARKLLKEDDELETRKEE